MNLPELLHAYVPHVAPLSPQQIPFDAGALDSCKSNSCGNYGKCWTCPPLVGDPETLMSRVRAYRQAYVFSCVYPLEDSFDIEGMQAGKQSFEQTVFRIQDQLPPNAWILGAGGCGRCPVCAAREGQPCRLPQKALISLEACGIFVSRLAQACGLKYNNGPNTVTYFGMVLI